MFQKTKKLYCAWIILSQKLLGLVKKCTRKTLEYFLLNHWPILGTCSGNNNRLIEFEKTA